MTIFGMIRPHSKNKVNPSRPSRLRGSFFLFGSTNILIFLPAL